MPITQEYLYAGLAHVSYIEDPFDLGHNIQLRAVYANLFSVNMMASERAEVGKPTPGPWRAARGGFQHDVEAEIAVPSNTEMPGGLSCEDTIWLIVALLRLANYPSLMAPVISDQSFEHMSETQLEPLLTPFQLEPRIFGHESASITPVKTSDLEWVKSIWPRTAELIQKNPSFDTALRAIDICGVEKKASSALLTAWGALEQLFAPSRAELRFRVSANIAVYLEAIGPKRLELFKTVYSLYNARSVATHSAHEAKAEHLVQTFIILRNALIKMIDEGRTPDRADFEELLFCDGRDEV